MRKFLLSFLVVFVFTLDVLFQHSRPGTTTLAPVTVVDSSGNLVAAPAAGITPPALAPTDNGTAVKPSALPPSSPTSPTTGSATASNSGSSATANPAKYKNGTFVGQSVNAYYGNVQVQVVIASGQIADVQFLDYPQDRDTSRYISSQALPLLRQETIQAQSAQVDIVSGATSTSEGYQRSVASALQLAGT